MLKHVLAAHDEQFGTRESLPLCSAVVITRVHSFFRRMLGMNFGRNEILDS